MLTYQIHWLFCFLEHLPWNLNTGWKGEDPNISELRYNESCHQGNFRMLPSLKYGHMYLSVLSGRYHNKKMYYSFFIKHSNNFSLFSLSLLSLYLLYIMLFVCLVCIIIILICMCYLFVPYFVSSVCFTCLWHLLFLIYVSCLYHIFVSDMCIIFSQDVNSLVSFLICVSCSLLRLSFDVYHILFLYLVSLIVRMFERSEEKRFVLHLETGMFMITFLFKSFT